MVFENCEYELVDHEYYEFCHCGFDSFVSAFGHELFEFAVVLF